MPEDGFIVSFDKDEGLVKLCHGSPNPFGPALALFGLDDCSDKLQKILNQRGQFDLGDPDCASPPAQAVRVNVAVVFPSSNGFIAQGLQLASEPSVQPHGGGNLDDLPPIDDLAPTHDPPQAAAPAPLPPPAAVAVAHPSTPTRLTYSAQPMLRNDHFFMFSDNWEALKSLPPGKQCLCAHSHSSNQVVTYRTLLWHLNLSGGLVQFGLTLENTGSSPIRVARRRISEDLNNPDYFDCGRSLARDALQDSLKLVGDLSVSPGQVVALNNHFIESNANRHSFSMLDFELHSGAQLNYTLRSAADKTQITSRTGAPAVAQVAGEGPWRGHARGVWPYNAVQVVVDQVIDVTRGLPATLVLGEHRQAPNVAADVAHFAAHLSVADGGDSRANRGMYGVDIFLILRLANANTTAKTVTVSFRTPFDDGKNGYTGAFRFNNKVGVIGGTTSRTHLGKSNPRTEKVFGIVVPGKTFTNVPFEAKMRIQHGGTSALPVEIIFG